VLPVPLDETIALLADGRLRLRAHQSMPMQQAADAHRQLESGNVHERIILTLPLAFATAHYFDGRDPSTETEAWQNWLGGLAA
jgi:Zinc-binding dehydrogenase